MLTRVPAVIDELAQGNPEALTAIAMSQIQFRWCRQSGHPRRQLRAGGRRDLPRAIRAR